jgi:cytochrome c biogenesis protein CcdA
MNETLVASASALWLGVLTSISPCPLATNIAAISYIGRRVDSTRYVLLAGLLYAVGRVAAYVALALLLIHTALSAPGVSLFLQRYLHLLLGPMLVLAGMLLVGLIQANFGSRGVSDRLQRRVDACGIWGALLLGALFALAFCPTSAALFFGNVMASLNAGSTVMLPLLYGVGTALPVIVSATLIALGSQRLGTAFNAAGKVEFWARHATGWAILLVGVWMTAKSLWASNA